MTRARSAAIGLVVTLSLAAWWLPALGECLRSGCDPAPLSTRLLAGLVLTRALTVCVAAMSATPDCSRQPSLLDYSLLVTMAWPLVLLAQWSSELPALRVIALELGLLLLCTVLAALARWLAHWPMTADMRRTAAASLGVLCGTLLWLSRDLYLGWLLT